MWFAYKHYSNLCVYIIFVGLSRTHIILIYYFLMFLTHEVLARNYCFPVFFIFSTDPHGWIFHCMQEHAVLFLYMLLGLSSNRAVCFLFWPELWVYWVRCVVLLSFSWQIIQKAFQISLWPLPFSVFPIYCSLFTLPYDTVYSELFTTLFNKPQINEYSQVIQL